MAKFLYIQRTLKGRRKHKVYVGKAGEKEIDFVTEGPEGTEYYQVSETLRGPETLARELAPLNAVGTITRNTCSPGTTTRRLRTTA